MRRQGSEVGGRRSVKKLLTLNFPLITFLFTVFCSLFTVCDASTVDEMVADLQKKYNEVQDVYGRFSQTSYLKDLGKTERYEGRFFVSKKAGIKMKWSYTKPRDEEVIITESDIWIYKKSEKQALRSKFNKDAYSQVPLALLSSLGNLKEDFIITMLKVEVTSETSLGIESYRRADRRVEATLREDSLRGDPLQENIFELKPKKQMGLIKKLLLISNTGDFPIKSFALFDIYGNKIDFVIKDIKVNQGLDESLFVFKAPADVEVFELSP